MLTEHLVRIICGDHVVGYVKERNRSTRDWRKHDGEDAVPIKTFTCPDCGEVSILPFEDELVYAVRHVRDYRGGVTRVTARDLAA